MTALLSGLAATVVLTAAAVLVYDIAQVTTTEAESPAGVHISGQNASALSETTSVLQKPR
jgi:hypothetical protein